MKISVVIPCFNHAQYLPDAIDSVFAQTKKTHELILIDDGSTDNSLDIMRSYKATIISQTNRGLSSARNTGIMAATGDYILFLDSDDILLENCLERIEMTIKETEADIIAPSFKCFGQNNLPIILGSDLKLDDFKKANMIGYCAAVKRTALIEAGGYSSRMNFGWEDWHLWINLLRLGKKIVTIPEPLWLYRTKAVSMITEANKHSDELMAQIKKDFPNVYS